MMDKILPAGTKGKVTLSSGVDIRLSIEGNYINTAGELMYVCTMGVDADYLPCGLFISHLVVHHSNFKITE